MEPILEHGDYIPDQLGGILHGAGSEALLARVLFRLTARRGGFPFLPTMGSRLHLLSRESPGNRPTAAKQYVTEALAEEEVEVQEVELLSPDGEHLTIRVHLTARETPLSLTVSVS